MFTEKDINQIKAKGIKPEILIDQLKRFEEGFPTLHIVRPALVEDGIIKLSREELDLFNDVYDNSELDVLKFVPASGAATRMFKSLFAFLGNSDGNRGNEEGLESDEDVRKFFESIKDFAFYSDLNQKVLENHQISIEQAIDENNYQIVIEELLKPSGLNYGGLPKGLLAFHRYADEVRTAAQEHLAECLDYVEKAEKAKVHFTISPAHREVFEKHISECIRQSKSDTEIEVTYSEQFSSTDTLASTSDFQPFRDEKEKLFFRPAGHGALLSNLNDLSADLIFIKNVDNVVPDHFREETVKYKKALAGVLLSYRERVFDLLRKSEEGKAIGGEAKAILRELGVEGDLSENQAIELLDRPLRVCGMVKNEGEPGGGPFWVKEQGLNTLQIIESAQVNKEDDHQSRIFKSGTHFNPVDILCSVKNHKGEKYDLIDFRDEETGFISEKSYNGEKLLAMELPGLWNGSMAKWNTVFVEVPLSTFNPVKTVNDLLKPGHR